VDYLLPHTVPATAAGNRECCGMIMEH